MRVAFPLAPAVTGHVHLDGNMATKKKPAFQPSLAFFFSLSYPKDLELHRETFETRLGTPTYVDRSADRLILENKKSNGTMIREVASSWTAQKADIIFLLGNFRLCW